MRNVVCTRDAPGVGHYSQAVKGGGFIFVSGQLALDPVTRQIIEGDASHQTERALQNVATVLKAAGSSLDSVVRCGVFLKNMDDFAAMNAVYEKIFGPHPLREQRSRQRVCAKTAWWRSRSLPWNKRNQADCGYRHVVRNHCGA
jgi:2-iminobutanoate/2-iminopropanoate deaminase